ncbi:MAG: alpha/beta fold hydrolase [Patescibacteria group bacterium]|nr:alpha/beta fold hydrolase [Patescibacteria group bacterium]
MTLKKLFYYLLIIPLGLVLISLGLFWITVHPQKINSSETPEKYKLAYENVSLAGFDGTKLTGWYLPAKKPTNKAILMLHGYPMDKGDLLPTATLFEINFNILLVDLRGMGQSGGAIATFGAKEQKDLKYALDFLEKKGNTDVGVFGYSEGGSIGLLAASQDKRIQAVAEYGAFTDLPGLVQNQYKKLGILDRPMAGLITFWERLFFGSLPNPAQAAEKITVPVLVIHNQGDEVVPFAQAQKLQAALSKNSSAEFYFPGGGSHSEPPLDFEIKTNNFFKTHLK